MRLLHARWRAPHSHTAPPPCGHTAQSMRLSVNEGRRGAAGGPWPSSGVCDTVCAASPLPPPLLPPSRLAGAAALLPATGAACAHVQQGGGIVGARRHAHPHWRAAAQPRQSPRMDQRLSCAQQRAHISGRPARAHRHQPAGAPAGPGAPLTALNTDMACATTEAGSLEACGSSMVVLLLATSRNACAVKCVCVYMCVRACVRTCLSACPCMCQCACACVCTHVHILLRHPQCCRVCAARAGLQRLPHLQQRAGGGLRSPGAAGSSACWQHGGSV